MRGQTSRSSGREVDSHLVHRRSNFSAVVSILVRVSAAPSGLTTPAKEEVRRFWQQRPCGSRHAAAPEGSPEFFRQVEQSRDRLEPFIARYARFEEARGRSVLEIGTGLGTDLAKFARAGARVTGVDLTERAISLVRSRLELERLDGELLVADAEALPFADGQFDVVYSWGVLHHTPDTARAVSEALRVLRPGGRVCVMLYARHSWVAVGLWLRYALLAGRPARGLKTVVADHMESVGTRAYSRREVQRMFGSLEGLRIRQQLTPYDRRVAGPMTALTGGRLGWFLVVDGRKPLTAGGARRSSTARARSRVRRPRQALRSSRSVLLRRRWLV